MSNSDKDMSEPEKQDRKSRLIMAILIVVVLIGTVIFAFLKPDEEVEVVQETQLEDGWYDEVLSHLPPEPAAPEELSSEITSVPTIELPSLDDSDPLAQQQVALLNPSHQLLPWLGPEHIIRRGVTVINGLGEGVILSKLLKIPSPKGQFRADKTSSKTADKTEQQYWISNNNYQRYEYLVDVITSVDKNQLVETYRLLHPLLDNAYEELGIPGRTFDTVIVDAIDQVLSAPVLDSPAELKLTSVTYTFADPYLESLPPIQKLLIRMGPENAKKMQQAVLELRTQMLNKGGALGQKPN